MKTKLRSAALAAGSVLCGSQIAHAAETPYVSAQIGNSDGAYGRFSGDTELSVAAGVELAQQTPRLDLRIEAHYFWTVGIYGHFSQALGRGVEPQVFGFGVNFRPAFLPRFGLDLEQGPARLDLFVDSIAVSFGPYWGNSAGGSFDHRGFEASLAAAFPVMPTAQGLWIEGRIGARFPDAGNAGKSPLNGALLVCYRFLWTSPLAL